MTLGLTVLLAFYVLGLSIQDRIPETSEFVPLIGKLCNYYDINNVNRVATSVVDPGFPVGAPPSWGCRLLMQLHFEKIVCHNERIGSLRGTC